jgi:hypothetical protein
MGVSGVGSAQMKDHVDFGADSHQLHDPPLRLGVGLDVALGGRQVRVAGERLDVPQRPADGRDLSGCVGGRPLWLEHPENPRSRYQRENRLTIAWGEVRVVRSVVITKGDGRALEGERRRL